MNRIATKYHPGIEWLKKTRRSLRIKLAQRQLLREWSVKKSTHFELKAPKPLNRLLILPCDPWTFIGSKGDEAMVNAAVGHLAAKSSGLSVGVIVASASAAEAAIRLGYQPLFCWAENWSLGKVLSGIDEFDPDMMLTLGADVMDGYYSPQTTSRLLITADIVAARGVLSIVLGFSFNKNPNPDTRVIFERLDSRLSLNVRDPISLERFHEFTSRAARLVADAAFMLTPNYDGDGVTDAISWANSRRLAGDVVIGLNIHPMLIRKASDAQVADLVQGVVAAVKHLPSASRISVALIPHDYRGAEGDDVCLAPIYEALASTFGGRIIYPRAELSAAQLKAIAGSMDGVITGRMHLAVASLGMGVPVAGLTYQDKFHGLFLHFGLPNRLLLSPEQVIDGTSLGELIEGFICEIPTLRALVQNKLPGVKLLSLRNLDWRSNSHDMKSDL